MDGFAVLMVAFGFVWHNFPASEPDFFSLFLSAGIWFCFVVLLLRSLAVHFALSGGDHGR